MTDIILETIRAFVLLGIVIFLWKSGRKRFLHFRTGWNLIIAGFGLLLFGSVLDISDNFEQLNPFIVVGDTEVEAFLEKFVGFLGGFVLLAVGLVMWIPGVQGLSDLVETRTQDLQLTNQKLHAEIAERNRVEKIKHDFIATVSHELRTPLTSIKGTLSLLCSGTVCALPDEARSMLDIAENNSDRLMSLINDLLDIEKIESGKMDFCMQPVDMVELTNETLEINQGYADRHGVTLVNNAVEAEAWTEGDKDRLIQVLSNLLSNAAKFSPPGSQIELSVARDNADIRASVKDQGPGIPQDFRSRLFEKFTQLDSADNRKTGGTGLGLSIAKAIVDYHGGTIGFTPNTDGPGTTFFFTLPVLR